MGPSEMLYLNQIATFRLARSEVKQQLRMADCGRKSTLNGRDDGSVQRERSSTTTSGPRYPRPDGVYPGVNQTAQTSNNQENINGASAFWNIAMPPTHLEPGTSGGTSFLPLDEGQYLRMAEEISNYMTWDGWYQSGTDYDTPQFFGMGNEMSGI